MSTQVDVIMDYQFVEVGPMDHGPMTQVVEMTGPTSLMETLKLTRFNS